MEDHNVAVAGADQEQATRKLPLYRSHKEVGALEIMEVRPDMPPQQEGEGWAGLADWYLITPAEEGYALIRVNGQIFARYMPKPGDFYIVYADGYQSISPRDAFVEGYTKI